MINVFFCRPEESKKQIQNDEMRMTLTLFCMCFCYIIFVAPIVLCSVISSVPANVDLICFMVYWFQVLQMLFDVKSI